MDAKEQEGTCMYLFVRTYVRMLSAFASQKRTQPSSQHDQNSNKTTMVDALIYIGASLTLLWGLTHLFPTRDVVKGFGDDLSKDNRNIITMEWINEGVTLIILGVYAIVVTTIDSSSDESRAVYIITSVALFVLATISLFTGFKINFLPFRMCPFIFAISAVLILIGAFV